MTIHREGYLTLLIVLAGCAALNFSAYVLLDGLPAVKYAVYGASMVMLLFFVQFFRKPSRKFLLNDNAILAPADGTVVAIEEIQEGEYFSNEKKLQISIFMSPLNVHINWAPVAGVIRYVKYHPGAYLVAWHPKSSSDNERTTLVIEPAGRPAVMIKQIAGAVARRIIHYAAEGKLFTQGEEIGFIRFGSRVDVICPPDVKVNVRLNQKVEGLTTAVAFYA